jgi:hypothetical protein
MVSIKGQKYSCHFNRWRSIYIGMSSFSKPLTENSLSRSLAPLPPILSIYIIKPCWYRYWVSVESASVLQWTHWWWKSDRSSVFALKLLIPKFTANLSYGGIRSNTRFTKYQEKSCFQSASIDMSTKIYECCSISCVDIEWVRLVIPYFGGSRFFSNYDKHQIGR